MIPLAVFEAVIDASGVAPRMPLSRSGCDPGS
jgi:hypothetical protein